MTADYALGRRHKIALANHCRLASETLHPRFREMAGPYSTILTVNTGYE